MWLNNITYTDERNANQQQNHILLYLLTKLLDVLKLGYQSINEVTDRITEYVV